MFLLTMQNHVPYQLDYFESIRESDRAVEFLLARLAQSERKTIVVFWGDHLPGIFDRGQLPLPQRQQTPLFIWTNFDSQTQELGAVSPIFFNQHVLDVAGLRKSGFDNLMSRLFGEQKVLARQLEEVFPVAASQVLSDYEMIEYDILSGERYSLELGFFD
jgi:hypothetical protein